MSTFLGPIPPLQIPLNSTPAGVYSTLKSVFTTYGYQIVQENAGIATPQMWVLPPASEAVGDGRMRDVLMIEVGTNYLNFRPVSQALQAFPQVVYLWPKTGGAASNAVTLGGVTIQQDPATLAAGNTAAQNLRFLFEALASSTDPVVSDFTWDYQSPAPQNADDGNPNILGVRKTAVANVSLSPNANVNATNLSNYAAPGLQDANVSAFPLGVSLTTDLVYGFVIYLQLCSRGLAVGTKCNSGFSGPAHACWGDHATAMALVPPSKFPQFLSPIELIVGTDDDANNLDSWGRTSKCWTISYANKAGIPNESYCSAHPFGRFLLRQRFVDSNNPGSGGALEFSLQLRGSGIWVDDMATGNDFQVHRVTMAGNALRDQNVTGSGADMTSVIGAIRIEDWYKFRGSAVDEGLLLVADTVQVATLSQSMDAATDYSEIYFESTTQLAPAGYVILDDERFRYTGKDDATGKVTGVTRGVYGSAKTRHFVGTDAYQGLWFTKIGGGALLQGYQRPTA